MSVDNIKADIDKLFESTESLNEVVELKRTIEVEIRGTKEAIELTLEREEFKAKKPHVNYWVSAVCNGLDLTTDRVGYFKAVQAGNPRMKSKDSINKEATEILDSYETCIRSKANSMIVKDLTTTYKLCTGDDQLIEDHWVPTTSFKSLQSGLTISWYYHDVFNTDRAINCLIKRNTSGHLEVFADDYDLYNLEKLQTLANSERFKEQRFAFFFYNEVNRLLGRPIVGNERAMSGLLAQPLSKTTG